MRDDDFEYQGRPYKSLSAIARAITGTRWNGLVFFGLKSQRARHEPRPEGKPIRKLRCAVYTRKSTEEGLEQEFNSLDAQREACEAYIASQSAEGWVLVPDRYDDGGILRRHAGAPGAASGCSPTSRRGASTSSSSTRSTGSAAR